jgi:protein PsiE
MQLDQTEGTSARVEGMTKRLGDRLVRAFQLLALFVIGGSIVWSAVEMYIQMMQTGHATLHNILLLFIYLELGAMVGIYFQTNELPVEFLLYVAITVITRTLVEVEHLSDVRVITLAASILVLAGAAALLRYSAKKFRDAGHGGGANETNLPA